MRAVLIHRGLKLISRGTMFHVSLRAVLIHRGLKLKGIGDTAVTGLRAVLIHRGLKPFLHNLSYIHV